LRSLQSRQSLQLLQSPQSPQSLQLLQSSQSLQLLQSLQSPEFLKSPQSLHSFSVMVFAVADVSSGTPLSWKATATRPGVFVMDMQKMDEVHALANHIRAFKQTPIPPTLTSTFMSSPQTSTFMPSSEMFVSRHASQTPRFMSSILTVISIHQGSNWGWEVDPAMRRLAHYLIDMAGVDLIHGHSSHHFRPIEVYRGKLVLFGCSDLLSDYEVITPDPLQAQYLPHVHMA